MNTALTMERMAKASPNTKARIAAVFYLLNIVTGALALAFVGLYGNIVTLIATACYVVVTVLFYDLFKPVSQRLSGLAAFASLVGCVVGVLSMLRLVPAQLSPLVFFGFYCLLIGYLIVRSTFLPRILGVLMAIGGLGWLTFLSPSLAQSLSPYVLLPGIIGESVLTLWLLIAGVNVERWREQAEAMRERL